MTILILFLWITIESECKYMVFFNTTKIIAFFCFLKICGHVFFSFVGCRSFPVLFRVKCRYCLFFSYGLINLSLRDKPNQTLF